MANVPLHSSTQLLCTNPNVCLACRLASVLMSKLDSSSNPPAQEVVATVNQVAFTIINYGVVVITGVLNRPDLVYVGSGNTANQTVDPVPPDCCSI